MAATRAEPAAAPRPSLRPARVTAGSRPVIIITHDHAVAARTRRRIEMLDGRVIGVANIMVSSVLERRQQIGLRRALGATRGQIRTQFLAEAVLLSLAGGTAGVAIGAAATIAYAHTHHEPAVIPAQAWAGGLAAAVIIGALAGLLPAIRAARLSPTRALWSI